MSKAASVLPVSIPSCASSIINKSHSKSATQLNFLKLPPKYIEPFRSCKERNVNCGFMGFIFMCCSLVIVRLLFKEDVSEINE